MRRSLAWLVLGTALVGSSAAPVPAEASVGSGWATWTVDQTKKTITVVAKLQIYLGPCIPYTSAPDGAEGGPGSTGRDCSVTAAQIAEDIRLNIEAVWNGHSYKCYRLIFKVDVAVTTDRFHVDGSRVGVRIDRSTTPIRSWVMPTVGSGIAGIGRWDSNEPGARADVDNSLLHPSTWAYPTTSPFTWAHEFGHVLGLHDQYVEGTWVPRPGAPSDVMWSSRTDVVAQSTINRVVERNRDRLVDTKGKKVDLEDLVCELRFRAHLAGSERDYRASNIIDSLAVACGGDMLNTSSGTQRLGFKSEPLDLWLRELGEAALPGHYRLTPVFDELQAIRGLSASRSDAESNWFDLPVTVDVERDFAQPAAGETPEPYDLRSGACAGGGKETPQPLDCGRRQYVSYMAMEVSGLDDIAPAHSKMPATLGVLGFSDARLDTLYKNCPGQRPWPGEFIHSEGGSQTPGQLPPLQALKDVAGAWLHDNAAGKIEINGTAVVHTDVAGHKVDNDLEWTLTLCPLNADDQEPPDCP